MRPARLRRASRRCRGLPSSSLFTTAPSTSSPFTLRCRRRRRPHDAFHHSPQDRTRRKTTDKGEEDIERADDLHYAVALVSAERGVHHLLRPQMRESPLGRLAPGRGGKLSANEPWG